MAIEGVSSQAQAQQQSLINQAAGAGQESEGSGSVQQQMQVQVMQDSMQQKGQQTMEIINSSMGLGQNVDIQA